MLRGQDQDLTLLAGGRAGEEGTRGRTQTSVAACDEYVCHCACLLSCLVRVKLKVGGDEKEERKCCRPSMEAEYSQLLYSNFPILIAVDMLIKQVEYCHVISNRANMEILQMWSAGLCSRI